MATQIASSSNAEFNVRVSWLPMIVIALGQMLLSFNASALPVSMGGIVKSFDAPPTAVATAIVVYALGVSGFIMLGAKFGQRFGSQRGPRPSSPRRPLTLRRLDRHRLPPGDCPIRNSPSASKTSP